jgi:pimeloyl-ACP methyl ester carboxylesterase
LPRLAALAALLLAVLLVACDTSPVPPPQPTANVTLSPTVPPPAPSPTPSPSLSGDISQTFDVDGHKLMLWCEGTGSPTVVLDSGLGVVSLTWNKAMFQIAQNTRVCRYDRAGLGLSEPGPRPRTSKQIVQELHTLLDVAGVPGPYILTGASFGGLNMQLYSTTYPQDVAGLVLVDSLHPDLDAHIEQLLTPEQAQQRRRELANNSEGVTFDDLLASGEQVRAAGKLPDVPLVVLLHGRPFDASPGYPIDAVEKLWADLQTDLASTSTSKLVLAERSGHRIHESQPDLVADAVRWVIDQSVR